MNNRSIEQAVDTDLRLSIVALRRAAQRARDLAQRTGTDLVVVEHGQLLHIAPVPPSERARWHVQDMD